MGQDERLLLGWTFGAAATAYAEHRPDYAQAAVRWALERAPGPRVLDLGAGTGKLTATLVALGAEDNRVDWVAELERISGSAAIGPRDTLSSWRAETAEAHLPNGGSIAQFGASEQAEFPHGQRRTAYSLVATLATKAGMLVMPAQEQEATLARIRTFLASRPETARGEFTLPMLTGVLRVARL